MRAIGAWNAVIPYGSLTAACADAIIAEQAAFFRRLALERGASGASGADEAAAFDGHVEWKVYAHDRPADLGARLSAAGFQAEEHETLMVYDLANRLPTAESAAGPVVTIRVSDRAGLADFVAAAALAFDRDAEWQTARRKQYERRLHGAAVSFYTAYAGGRPVGSARAEFPEGGSFAGLWGGGTIPAYRGRGVYRMLVHARAQEAHARGYRYLRVDARATSRPILERLGFIPLTEIIEWRLPLVDPSSRA